MAKWNPLALKLLMWVMGVLIVMGSGLGFIGGTFFPFDQLGRRQRVGGRGRLWSGHHDCRFRPNRQRQLGPRARALRDPGNRLADLRSAISIGHFDIIPFVIAIIVGVIVLVLYPNKPALFMQGSAKMGGARA